MSVSNNAAPSLDDDEAVALARFYIEKNQLDQAILLLKQVVVNPACDAEALAMLARVYAQLGLFKRSQELFKAYLVQRPAATNEQFQLAMTHFNNGEAEQAQFLWDAILATYPTHPPALYYSGLHFAQSGKTMEAKRSLDILLQSVAPDNLYSGRGKDLLRAIGAGLQTEALRERPDAETMSKLERFQ